MTQYLLSVHNIDGEEPLPEEEMLRSFQETGAVNEEIKAAGAWVFAGGLHADAVATATVVRSVDGKIVTTDGPFAESKESLGGFWVIDVEDLDAALAWAAKGTVACRRPIEVRPFHDESSDLADIMKDRYSLTRPSDA